MAAKDAGNDAPTIDALSDEFCQARKRELISALKSDATSTLKALLQQQKSWLEPTM